MSRSEPDAVKQIACVGTGTIGAGWAALFLARGFDVVATDPGEGAQAHLERLVGDAWPKLARLGLAESASRDRLRFVSRLEDAVGGADFIQESAPDREDLKIELFERIGDAARHDVVIASSSSQFLPSRLAVRCRHPERCIVAHPFAPSYLMPLVEVVGAAGTDPQVMDWAVAFYERIGKKALRLKKEGEWFIANRLQLVVFAEASRLVAEGICEFEDVDTAMAFGPGLRWAFAGPALCYHMGGGKGGVRHMIDHFGWKGDLATADRLVAAVDRMTAGRGMDEIESWRDDNLLALLGTLKRLR
jgi:3-hydroxyacyl-CoA dehydrogenase